MARITWKREGDDYLFDLHNDVSVSVMRLAEESSGLYGELTIKANGAVNGGLIHSARINLMASQTRHGIVKACAKRYPAMVDTEWQDAIEHVCFITKEKYREGAPLINLKTVAPRERTRWLLEPFIEDNAVTVIFGDGESGKTGLALAMVATIATGRNVVGRLHGPPRPVMVLDWEDDECGHAERVRAICSAVDMEVPDVYYRPMVGSLYQSAAAVRRDIDRHKIGLVMIDSAGLAKGGEPESADASLRLFAAARSLRVPVLMVDHVSIAGMTGDKKRPYGSVYTRNSARVTWYVEKAQTDEPCVVDVGLTHTKGNHGVRLKPLAYRMRYLNDENHNPVAIYLNAIEPLSVPEFAESKSMPERIMYELEQRNGAKLTNKELAEYLGVDVEKVKPASSRLAHKGVIIGFPRLTGQGKGEYEYGLAYRGASG